MDVNILLFPDFTALDVFGPVEVLSTVEDYKIRFVSREGGVITNHQNISIITEKADEAEKKAIWFIPGGWGTRALCRDEDYISWLKGIAEGSLWFLTVCTGSAVLARTGLLDGKHATSNKKALEWVMSQGPGVLWDKKARYCAEGKYYTSSGVSAGIDMALGFVKDRYNLAKAEGIAKKMEYVWNR